MFQNGNAGKTEKQTNSETQKPGEDAGCQKGACFVFKPGVSCQFPAHGRQPAAGVCTAGGNRRHTGGKPGWR